MNDECYSSNILLLSALLSIKMAQGRSNSQIIRISNLLGTIAIQLETLASFRTINLTQSDEVLSI